MQKERIGHLKKIRKMIKYLYKTNYGELKNVKRIMSLFIAALLITKINK